MRFKNRRYRAPSGLRNCWMLWRHCCCRYGAYPLAVAPFLTLACVLSLYASSGCAFLDLSVGFVPSNTVWNQSHMELGLFYYYDRTPVADEDGNMSLYDEYIRNRACRSYPTDFEEAFIARDRTWTVARVMAYISGAASAVAAITVWMVVFTPMPAGCLWPGVLLPVVIMALIAEGSKFLLFDIALCRNEVWFPSGVDSLPTSAESCTLGTTAYTTIASGIFFMVCLLMVCLKAPEKRVLDPDFGVVYRTGAELDLGATDEEEEQHYPSLAEQGFEESVLEEDLYTADPAHDDSEAAEHSSSGEGITADPEDGVSTLASTLASESPRNPVRSTTAVDMGEDPVKPPPLQPIIVQERVSESRLSTMSKIELSANGDSEDLLEQLVSDLDTSFQKQPSIPNAGREKEE